MMNIVTEMKTRKIRIILNNQKIKLNIIMGTI